MSAIKPLIAIIILHFGKWEVTKDCLDSLQDLKQETVTKRQGPGNKNPKKFTYKVIVIDNSQNTALHQTIIDHPAVSVLLSPRRNLGFAGGNNHGIEEARKLKADYVLFLNNDTQVNDYFLANLLSEVINKKKLVLAGPAIEHQINGKTFCDYGGYMLWQHGQARHVNKETFEEFPQYIERDFVSGCCLLVPMAVLDTIGGFDESYFLYLEDVELCLRAKQNKFKTILVPKAKIFHKGSQSSTELTKILYSWRNSAKLTLRYVPKEYRITALFFNAWFYPALFVRWKTIGLLKSIFAKQGKKSNRYNESMPVSIIVLTHNNEKIIAGCIKSVSFADEIIVVDDNSTDKTLEIIKTIPHGNLQMFSHSLEGDFASQRNFGLEQAHKDWVLFIDADEEVSDELRKEIIHVTQTPAGKGFKPASTGNNGYFLNRKDVFLGRELKHGETGNIKLLRLAKKGAGIWAGRIHEVWKIKGEIGQLHSPLIHHHDFSVSEFLKRLDWYSTIRAQELYQQGIREPLWRIFFNPILKFKYNYFLKLGFMDGFPGLAMAWLMSWHSFLVRVKLRLLWMNEGKEAFEMKQ